MSSLLINRIASFAAVGCVLVLSASCGGDGEAPVDGGHFDGVEMSVQPDMAKPGEELALTIRNETGEIVSYGAAFELEREVNGDWEQIELDLAFIQILLTLDPGEGATESVPLPDDLEPGVYRIIKTFDLPGPDQAEAPRRQRPSAEFEVVAG